MKNIRYFLLLIFISVNYSGFSQSDGTWDIGFNYHQLYPYKTIGSVSMTRIFYAFEKNNINNTYVIGGDFSDYGGISVNNIVFTDSQFRIIDSITINTGSGFSSTVRDIVIQPDGKIIVAGAFSSYNGNNLNAANICRLNIDGTLDTTFLNVPGFAGGMIYDLVQQPDGKIIAVGSFSWYNGVTIGKLIRILPDGSIDPSFDSSPGASGNIRSVDLQPDGKILIAGEFTSYNGTAINRLARLNSDGTIDATFNVGTGADNTVTDIKVLSNGQIAIGGNFTQYNSQTVNRYSRLNNNGSLDVTYTNNLGSGFSFGVDISNTVELLNNEVLICGNFAGFNGNSCSGYVKLKADGTIDSLFNLPVSGSLIIKDVEILPDSNMLFFGDFDFIKFKENGNGIQERTGGIMKTDENGNFDRSFNFRISANNLVLAIEEVENGNILIGGYFTAYNSVTKMGLAKLKPDGQLDTGFVHPVKGLVNVIKLASDGGYFIGGQMFYDLPNGTTQKAFVKLLSNGMIDTLFHQVSISGAQVCDIDILPDGRILLSGTFGTVDGITRKNMVRLFPNGTIDMGFNTTISTDGTVNNLLSEPGGTYLATGSFDSYNGFGRPCIARIDSTASLLPPYFTIFGTSDDVIDAEMINDKILVFYSSGITNNLKRLNSDGTVDNSFSNGLTGPGPSYSSVYVQPDGKILVATYSSTFGTATGVGLFRFNSDGTNDFSFQTNVGGIIYSGLDVLENGQIVCSGTITSSFENEPIHLIRLFNFLPDSSSNSATGKVFRDLNLDNIYNGSDQLIPNSLIQLQNNIVSASSNLNGEYSVWTNDTTANVSMVLPQNLTLYHNVIPNSYPLLFTGTNNFLTDKDFALQPIPNINDLEIYLNSLSPIRLGENNVVDVTIHNRGTTNQSPEITVITDTFNTFLSSIPVADYISGDTIIFNTGSLNQGESQTIRIYFNTASEVSWLGDTSAINASITPVINDTTGYNNSSELNRIILAAYDPNIKEVSDSLVLIDTLSNNFELDYTIHFQNTGNDTARYVFIKDSISGFLNLSTLDIVSSSHPMYLQIFNNQNITFNFPDINLPDSSTNESGSHGFIRYKIRPDFNQIYPGLAIQNYASIYFDNNPPVITNTIQSEFISPIGIINLPITNNRLFIYPNPSTGIVRIELDTKEVFNEVEICDITGKSVFLMPVNRSNIFNFNLSFLENGVYFINFRSINSKLTGKIILINQD